MGSNEGRERKWDICRGVDEGVYVLMRCIDEGLGRSVLCTVMSVILFWCECFLAHFVC